MFYHRVYWICLSITLLFCLFNPEIIIQVNAVSIPYYNQTNKNVTVYVCDKIQLGYSSRAYVGRHYTVTSENWDYDKDAFTGEKSNYTYLFTANVECEKVIKYTLRYKWTEYNSSYPNGRTQYGNVDVTWNITAIPRPAPEQIIISESFIDIPIGSNYQLNASIKPEDAFQTVIWTSNAPEIASVDENGLVTGVGLGDAIITVTSQIDNTIITTCNVHVGNTDVKTIEIPESQSLNIYEQTKLNPTITPSYAVYDLEWLSNNRDIAVVDQEGIITGVGPGEVDIMVTDKLTGVQAKCRVGVSFVVGDTFTANIPNGTGSVSTTFMLTDLENRYVSIGDGTNAAIATETTGSITIAETIVGPGNFTYTVNSISSRAFASSKISSVSIPQGITTIGDNAFNGCSNLTSVTVEWTEPLTINSTCFSNASTATLNVPKGCYVTYAEAENWSKFKTIAEPPHTNGDLFVASITAGSGTTDAVFKVIDVTNKYVSVGNGEESFVSDDTSGSVTIPSTVVGYDGKTYWVKELSLGAFFGCDKVTSVDLPIGITTIGQASFYDCSSLSSFTIPTDVTTIEEDAFNGCSGLSSITIPYNVQALGEGAFYRCNNLASVTVRWTEPIEIDSECFTNAKNATLNVPKGSYINYASADNWKNFKTIKEPAHSVGDTFTTSITVDGASVDATFKVTNTSSQYVSIGDGEDAAIDIFTSGNVVIPSTVKGYDGKTYTVKRVADAAFFGCENISSVSLPSVPEML